MAYTGWLTLGDAFVTGNNIELLNTERALAYIECWNAKVLAGAEEGNCINFIDACEDCTDLALILTNGAGYTCVEVDTAPWYDPTNGDSEQFLGVIGLEISNVFDSTAQANATQSLGRGGIVGPLYFDVREMVVRAIAVAATDCGMAYGLNWLRGLYTQQVDACAGDDLLFLDCCPVCDLEDEPGVDWCWPDTYGEMKVDPRRRSAPRARGGPTRTRSCARAHRRPIRTGVRG